jgi:galactose oxidase
MPTDAVPCCTTVRAPTESVTPARQGHWSEVFYLPNVAIHTHVLPNGKVLFWGRRDRPDGSMNEHECTPYVWDPEARTFFPTPQPMLSNEQTKVNLFCSGHAFLPDGRLLVAGGHLEDMHGDNQACVYDYRTNVWTALPAMNNGRWYPSAVALSDGSILVVSGTFFDGIRDTPQNDIPQIFDGQTWHSLSPPEDAGGVTLLSLYPRWHLLPDGRVVVTGTNAQGLFLKTVGAGTWTPAPGRQMLARDYAPSVMYDVGKVIYIGGGNDPDAAALPTDAVEIIDFNDAEPAWRRTASMNFRRRHHNGTLLPDGTILVTGGTQGTAFNDLDPGQPVHVAELWNPSTEQWTLLAAEAVDRCYHGTAVLLSDATVLSAGGGEGGSDPNTSHREAQIFRPPYLFRGARPEILSAPEHVEYGEEFLIEVVAHDIGMVSWIRLPSVTHAFNQNQRINFLRFTCLEETLKVFAPDRAELCPPGHYMLFVLDEDGVPSKAKILHVGPFKPAEREATQRTKMVAPLRDRQSEIKKANTGTRVTIGLTSTCPYGLGACWGGAYEALKKLSGVAAVQPIPNAEDSTADVYPDNHGLPDLDLWPEQFAKTATVATNSAESK